MYLETGPAEHLSQPIFAEKWLILNLFLFEKSLHCNNFAPFYEIDCFEVDGPNQF